MAVWALLLIGIAVAIYWFYIKPKWFNKSTTNVDENSDLDESGAEGSGAQSESEQQDSEGHSDQ